MFQFGSRSVLQEIRTSNANRQTVQKHCNYHRIVQLTTPFECAAFPWNTAA